MLGGGGPRASIGLLMGRAMIQGGGAWSKCCPVHQDGFGALVVPGFMSTH